MTAAAVIAVMFLSAGCEVPVTPSAAAGPSAYDDYCGEHGFVDGKKRNDAGEVIEECSLGPTPNGGAYSIARYTDGRGPASEDDASTVEITEYDGAANVIKTTYGTLGR